MKKGLTVKRSLLFVLLVVLLLILLLGGSQPPPSDAASGPCLARVIYTMPPEAGPGLAVQCGPSWRSTGCGNGGYFLHVGDYVFVTATQYNTSYGDIWYQLQDGFWVQAFGGYTAPIVYIQVGDTFCAAALPHLIGDWSWTS